MVEDYEVEETSGFASSCESVFEVQLCDRRVW